MRLLTGVREGSDGTAGEFECSFSGDENHRNNSVDSTRAGTDTSTTNFASTAGASEDTDAEVIMTPSVSEENDHSIQGDFGENHRVLDGDSGQVEDEAYACPFDCGVRVTRIFALSEHIKVSTCSSSLSALAVRRIIEIEKLIADYIYRLNTVRIQLISLATNLLQRIHSTSLATNIPQSLITVTRPRPADQ